MSTTWQNQFRRAVQLVVLAKGRPAPSPRDKNESYDWEKLEDRLDWTYSTYHPRWDDIIEHAKTCHFYPEGEVAPVRWSAFQGTFAENQEKTGLYAVCTCECGEYRDIYWLYEEDLGTVLKDLLAVPDVNR